MDSNHKPEPIPKPTSLHRGSRTGARSPGVPGALSCRAHLGSSHPPQSNVNIPDTCLSALIDLTCGEPLASHVEGTTELQSQPCGPEGRPVPGVVQAPSRAVWGSVPVLLAKSWPSPSLIPQWDLKCPQKGGQACPIKSENFINCAPREKPHFK